MMRCDVLATQDPKTVFPETVNTDVEIWREASSYSKALATSSSREVAKYTTSNGAYTITQKTRGSPEQVKERCQKSEAPNSPDNGIEGTPPNTIQLVKKIHDFLNRHLRSSH